MADSNALSLNRYLNADECLKAAIGSSSRVRIDRAMAVLGVLELAASSRHYEMGVSVHLLDRPLAKEFADTNSARLRSSPNFLAGMFVDRSLEGNASSLSYQDRSAPLSAQLSVSDLLALVELVETLVSNRRIERFVVRARRRGYRSGSPVVSGLLNILNGKHPDQDLIDFYNFTLGVRQFAEGLFEQNLVKRPDLRDIAEMQFGPLYGPGPLAEIFLSLKWRDPDAAETIKVIDTIQWLAGSAADLPGSGRVVTAGD